MKRRWKVDRLNPTPYAQEAELGDILANAPPDVVLIFGTATSKAAHWEAQRGYSAKSKTFGKEQGPGLGPRLSRYTPEFVQVSEALSPAHQWGTFEELLKRIHDGDELIFDMTHGFRAVAVVFSSAMHFLRLTRNIKLRHVFYGAHDSDPPEIVDYRNFYAVQDWTEAVSRLVDDADASKLAALATMGPISGRYDAQYFAVQRELIGLLLQHGLAMQAHTAMSEYIASLGLHKAAGLDRVKDHRGRRHADVFGVMVEVDPEVTPWHFDKEGTGYRTTREPWYARLEREGLLQRLRAVAGAIKPVRNGFAHGWTGRVRDGQDVARSGRDAVGQLEQITLEINELNGGLHNSTAVA
jgi:CRISPR-associated Csx2 family protein